MVFLVFVFPIFRSGGVRLWPPLHLYLPSPPRFPGRGMRAHEGLSTFPIQLFPGGGANLPRTTSSLFSLSLPGLPVCMEQNFLPSIPAATSSGLLPLSNSTSSAFNTMHSSPGHLFSCTTAPRQAGCCLDSDFSRLSLIFLSQCTTLLLTKSTAWGPASKLLSLGGLHQSRWSWLTVCLKPPNLLSLNVYSGLSLSGHRTFFLIPSVSILF